MDLSDLIGRLRYKSTMVNADTKLTRWIEEKRFGILVAIAVARWIDDDERRRRDVYESEKGKKLGSQRLGLMCDMLYANQSRQYSMRDTSLDVSLPANAQPRLYLRELCRRRLMAEVVHPFGHRRVLVFFGPVRAFATTASGLLCWHLLWTEGAAVEIESESKPSIIFRTATQLHLSTRIAQDLVLPPSKGYALSVKLLDANRILVELFSSRDGGSTRVVVSCEVIILGRCAPKWAEYEETIRVETVALHRRRYSSLTSTSILRNVVGVMATLEAYLDAPIPDSTRGESSAIGLLFKPQ